MADLHFLPWLRRGLVRSVHEQDAGAGALDAATLDVWVEVDGVRAERTVELVTPDRVTGLAEQQVARWFPRPGADDVADDIFPAIDFTIPDLPWLFTPAGADGQGRLRPWIVLVCVEESAATWTPATDDSLARLGTSTTQLPSPDEAWAWAHVQSVVPPAELAEALPTTPGVAVSRLICPRNLQRDTAYRVAVVPLFERDGDSLVPRWASGGPDVELPVLLSWTFATGSEGGFEALAKRLEPHATPERLGVHELDLSNPGGLGRWAGEDAVVIVEHVGALRDVGVVAKGLGSRATAFKGAVATLVEQGSQRIVLALDEPDPVVAPPNVGSLSSGATELPASGWQREVNVVPTRRVAAGLGAEVVRRNQERFVADAWKQAGQVREAWQAASETVLQAEVARTWQARTNRLADAEQLTVTRPQLTFARTADGQPVAAALRASDVPNAALTEAVARITRPGGVAAAATRTRTTTLRASATTTYLEATASVTRGEVLRFADVEAPLGAVGPNPVRRAPIPSMVQVDEPTLQANLGSLGVPSGSLRLSELLSHVVVTPLVVMPLGPVTIIPPSALPPGITPPVIASDGSIEPLRPLGPAGPIEPRALRPSTGRRAERRAAKTATRTEAAPTGRRRGQRARTSSAAITGAAAATPRAQRTPALAGHQLPGVRAADDMVLRQLTDAVRVTPLELVQTGAPTAVRVDVHDVARDASASISPLREARARLDLRIPGLADLWQHEQGVLPARVLFGPVLDEALLPHLIELGHDLVLPGVAAMPENRVRMVEGVTSFVAAFLAGANHEMARELLWREFPGDPGATVFRRFWDRYDLAATDIDPIHSWPAGTKLADLGAVQGEPTVLVTRGDVVRRFPSTRILLIRPGGAVVAPSFGTMLDASTRVDGFDADPDEVTGVEGWFVAIEEQQTEPTFGLDRPEELEQLKTWSDLAWAHLSDPDAGHVDVRSGLADGGDGPPGASWGRNAGHLARATHQRPFRLLMRATDLIGRP